ncbi:MAG: AAA family ATPase [Chloroflexota bacterium]|nr:AAA family ATPase [Chloroflexota bacterium]
MITLRRIEVTNVKSLRNVTLDFPERGAILVEGPNESGKSTLFESIYFGLYGAPLVTEENPRSLESLITHGEDSARVCLQLRTADATLNVQRTIRRNRSTQASLVVEAAGGESERITGVRAVNARVIEELGGLDGTALLNSCFVEQKKLSKLEELDARERRDSLLRILNLDQLSKLEDLYRVRAADEQRVADTTARLELASIREQTVARQREVQTLRNRVAESWHREAISALQSAETELEAAEEHVEALQQLSRLEQRQQADATQDGYERGLARLAVLRRRRPQAVLGGVAGTSFFLLAALIAFGAGATLVAAVSLLVALTVGVLIGYAVSRLSSEIADGEREVSRLRADRRSDSADAIRLRALLGLPQDADTRQELERATRAAGAAEQAVAQARVSLRAYPSSPSAALAQGSVPGETFAQDLAHAEEELRDLQARQRYLSESLGVADDTLGGVDVEAEHREAVRELETKRRASVILAEARRRIVDRVLPETERNMKLILPMLTAGRYHDARVTNEYRVDLWDEEAGRYVGKNVYSGGTKDQISLALRLAFAIASLPQELGSSPGFLFMDEPLSSFDEERTTALIELITRGELAAVFPQICIISHSRSFDPSLFPYVIRMQGGRVSYSNLDGRPNGS